MKVSELFRRLSYGEFSNLSISSSGSGKIDKVSYPKLIQYINQGLLALYSRFILSEKTVLIVCLEHVVYYHLKRRFAEASGSNETNHYIKDLIQSPFEEDVIKILEVFDSSGRPRVLNDKENQYSLFTPQPDILQVPNPIRGQALGIVYQARHRPLVDEGDDILSQDMDLPFFLEGALEFYVAHLLYSHMNGQENKITSQENLAKYEAVCAEVDSRDLANNTFATNHSKLEQRGFA